MKYLILGSKGQLAKEFLKNIKDEFFAFDKENLDITDENILKKTIDSIKPNFILNCSAYNNVDKAESDYETAYKVNALSLKSMALFSEKYKTKIIHFSTDYVFSGKEEQIPYKETDETKPLNKYGESKLEGERLLLENSSNSLVFRVSWLYGDGQQNFIYKIKEWSKIKSELRISTDEISIPTPTKLVQELTIKALNNDLTGIWHLVPSGFSSRYDWAKKIINKLKINVRILMAKQKDFSLPSKRPNFSAMNNEKISKELNIEIKNWEEYLNNYLI